MAIGTALAIGLGASAIGGVASAVSGNNASKRAAGVAQDTATQNNALAANIYGQNQQALSPFMQRGNAAGNQMNALLGLGVAQQPQQAMQQQRDAMSQFGGNAAAFNSYNPTGFQMDMARQRGSMFPAMGGDQFVSGAGPQQGMVQTSASNAQNAAFDNFRNSTGYQFRLGEGMNALNSGYAGAGVLQSGDAMRAAIEYGQNFASNEFGNYTGLLANQQGVGLAGASALAGVGQNYANNVSANNNSAGSALANAALARQNPFANALGTIGGGLFQYGLGG